MREWARAGALTAVAVSLMLVTAAGCGNSSGSESKGDGPVTLTYWGGAGTEKVAAVWNKSHPDIQVKAVNVTNGQEATTKLLTAIAANNGGAPDVMGTEYANIPTLVAKDALADVAKQGASELKDSFPASAWSAVTLGGDSVYGVPGDIGPMMFYYRKDVFQKLGIAVPKTWDQYAAAAKKIHDNDPKVYLGTFTGADASVFASLTQQAGASWWAVDGDAWSVDIDSAATQKVASFWGELVESGVIDNQPLFTPQWNAAINSGKQVGWLSPVWGAGVLASNAAATKGKWAAAALPVWDEASPSSGNWGGQAQVVISQSKHPKEAYEFVKWLGTSKEGLSALVANVGIYPAALDKQGTTDTPPPFLPDQANFYDLAANSAKLVPAVAFGPNVNVAYTAFVDKFGKAVKDRKQAEFLSALTAVQKATVDDLKSSGFTVK